MKQPIVVMGPSGSGKTTLAAALAGSLERPFVEGDDLHPPTNRERMARGQPLTDADRVPFLDAVAAALQARPVPIVTCSALKRSYRDRLRAKVPTLLFLEPRVESEELRRRVASRQNHFMPVSLVDDQIATLEHLQEDEAGLVLDGSQAPVEQVALVLAKLNGLR
jgi:gluconokinase